MNFFDSRVLPKKIITAIFLTKIIFGILLWAVYTYHYTYRNTSDAFRFFDDAVVIFNSTKGNFLHFAQIVTGINSGAEHLNPYLASTNHWYRPYDYGLMNDDRTLIRFNAIVLFFSFGYYHVHTVFINFLSLIGLVAFYRTFVSWLPDRKTELFVAVFLIPTVLFWGSGVMKEGLILFGLGLFMFSFSRIINHNFFSKTTGSAIDNLNFNPAGGIRKPPVLINEFITLAASLFLLSLVKVYVLVCLLPAIISLAVIGLSGTNKIARKFFFTHFFLILLALNIHHIFKEYNILEILQIKQRDFYNVAELWNAGSLIDIGRLEPNLLSFIKNGPQALFTVFFRPHLFEVNSPFLFASAIENFIFFILFLFYLFQYKKIPKQNIQWLLFCVSFVIFLALLIGWTTPIMGALVRYKLPLLPFLLISFLFISKKPEFISKFDLWIKSF